MNTDLTFDGRIPGDFMTPQETSDRILGQREVQYAVLKWAVAWKAGLTQEMSESLIKTMEDIISERQEGS